MEFDKIREIIASVLDPERPERFDPITEQTKLIGDLGANSMDKFEIILRIEDEFAIEIKNTDMSEFSTVGDLLSAIRNTK